MSRFIRCGELRSTDGDGFYLPFLLAMKNGVFRGDIEVTKDMVKNGRLDFPFEIKEVTGSFYCKGKKLKSLEGAPQKVGKNFDCGDNKLTSLKGAPQKVGGYFDCSGNELTSLIGAPEKVGDSFWCDNNKLTTLKGAPKKVGGYFYCSNNTKQFTEEEVRAVCNVKGRVIV